MKSIFILVVVISSFSLAKAQSLSYTDPAAAYNRLLLENGAGTYIQIGNFRVHGNQYLYGGKINSQVYANHNPAPNELLTSFDTYKKELMVYESNSQKLISLFGVDSFQFKTPNGKEINILAAKYVDSTKKGYYQMVLNNSRIKLVKYYETKLVISTTNYVQSEYREFSLDYDYYFIDKATGIITPINTYYTKLKKLLKDHVDIEEQVKRFEYNSNVEEALIKIFNNYK
jgi:hypothetical protein